MCSCLVGVLEFRTMWVEFNMMSAIGHPCDLLLDQTGGGVGIYVSCEDVRDSVVL